MGQDVAALKISQSNMQVEVGPDKSFKPHLNI